MIKGITILACVPLLANAQWTNAPGVTNAAGSWTNTPGGGETVPGPNVEPDVVKPGPATESWRRHVGQTTDAHGGIVANPTNAAQTGWALRYSATGRPYYAPIQATDLITGYTTNQDNSITTNTALDTFTDHVAETNDAHGGIMMSASNPGANGQVLLLNGSTGRPYWGDPVIEGGINYLITSGVARVNGRYATTNYTVTVTNGSWDGATAILTKTGSLTIVSSEPISRWDYDHTTANGISLADLIDTGAWETNAHGLIDVGDIYSCRISAYASDAIPSIGDPEEPLITISNLAVWTWGQAGVTGTTNQFEGTTLIIDDPADPHSPVNLRTMENAIDAIGATPSQWAQYDAAGQTNLVDGPNMAGRRLYLDNQWSLLGNGRYCALSYNGKDILYVTMSNQMLGITNMVITPTSVSLYVQTNGVTSAPWIEWTADLMAENWSEITNTTATYPTRTNGAYLITFSNVWSTAYFRAVQTSSNVNSLVATIPVDARGGVILGGVKRTSWPATIQPVTNVTINVTTNVMVITTVITNIGGGGGGIGSYTNTQINGVTHSNGVMIGDSETTTWTCGTDGVWRVQSWSSVMPASWDADLINTNSLDIKVGGMRMLEFTTNGIIMHHGTIQMYEEQLWANIELYDGTRLAPSLTFHGHPGEWGLYGRGYNGHFVAGWSVAGTEIGLLHAGGITLMDTNAGFYGRLVGDISGATGYPEPIFEAWRTNMYFNSIGLSNLTMLNGPINVNDSLSTTRSTLDITGLTYRDAGGIIRNFTGGGKFEVKNATGVLLTRLDNSLKLYDFSSGNTLMDLGGAYGDSIVARWPAGYASWQIGYLNGIELFDWSTYYLRSRLSSTGLTLLNATSNVVFQVDSTGEKIYLTGSIYVTNSATINLYGTGGSNTTTIAAQTGNITTIGTVSAAHLSLTNAGSVKFYTGTNLIATITATNGGLMAFGKLISSTNWPSGSYTNLGIGGKTNIFQMSSGNTTNVIIL